MSRIPIRPIALFLTIAVGGGWLVASPLWISGQGLAMPGATVLLVVMMFVPTLAAWITGRVLPSGQSFLTTTTVRPAVPFRRWLPYAILAWLAPIALMAASLGLAALLGVYRFDLEHFSGATALLEEASGGVPLPMPVALIVLIQLVSLPFAPAVNVIPALGEDLGWRGFLQTQLLPLGQWPAVLITGVVWGLWHAPVILLGYNYPGYQPFAALGMMVVFCVLVSVLLGWLTIASGTVWTAAIGHGFINGVAGVGALLSTAGPVDTGTAGLLGYTGWICMGVLVLVLVALRRFPVRGAAPAPPTAGFRSDAPAA